MRYSMGIQVVWGDDQNGNEGARGRDLRRRKTKVEIAMYTPSYRRVASDVEGYALGG